MKSKELLDCGHGNVLNLTAQYLRDEDPGVVDDCSKELVEGEDFGGACVVVVGGAIWYLGSIQNSISHNQRNGQSVPGYPAAPAS